jgi:hypothetical protein
MDQGHDKHNPDNTEALTQGIERSTWAVLLNNTRPPKIPSRQRAKRKREEVGLIQDAGDLKDPQQILDFAPRPWDKNKSPSDILELWDSDLIESPVFPDSSLLHSPGSYFKANASPTAGRDLISSYWNPEGKFQPAYRVSEAILSPIQTLYDSPPDIEAQRLDETHILHDSVRPVSIPPSPCSSSNMDPSLFSSFEEFFQGT